MSEASEVADDLNKLVEASTRAAKSLAEGERAASLMAGKLDRLRGAAIGALGGEETVEKYGKARDALRLAGDSSLSAGQRMIAGASAAKFAAGAVGSLAVASIDAARGAAEATARTEMFEQRMQSLAGSTRALSAATSGAYDVQIAFAAQFALADQGLEANSRNLALYARASREFATERQISQEQASAVVQRALAGDQAAAAQFGISLAGVTSQAEAQRRVLDGLAQAQSAVAAPAQTAAERAREQSQAWEAATDAGKGLLYYAFYPLSRALSDYADNRRKAAEVEAEAARYTDAGAQAELRASMARQRTIDIQRQQQALQRQSNADASASLELQLRVGQAELARAGSFVAALGDVISAEDQLRAATLAANEAEIRTGETADQFRQRRLKLQGDLTAALRRYQSEQQAADNSRQLQVEGQQLAYQLRLHGATLDARVRQITPMQRLRDLANEMANFAQRESETADQAQARWNALAQQRLQAQQTANEASNRAADTAAARLELEKTLAEASAMELKRVDLRRRAGEQTLEFTQRMIAANRTLITQAEEATQSQEAWNRVAEQSRVIADKFAQAARDDAEFERDRAIEMERADDARARALFEQINAQRALADQRKTELEDAQDFERQLRRSFGLVESLGERSETATERMTDGLKEAAGGFGELTRGILEASTAAAASGEDVGAAVAKTVDEWAAAKAVQWGLQSIEALASAGLAYFIRPDAVPGLLASAASFAGLAAVAGITTAAIPNAPAAAASSTAGGGDRLASSSRNDRAMESKGAPAIVFNLSGFVSNEAAQDGLIRALEDARRRGIWQG